MSKKLSLREIDNFLNYGDKLGTRGAERRGSAGCFANEARNDNDGKVNAINGDVTASKRAKNNVYTVCDIYIMYRYGRKCGSRDLPYDSARLNLQRAPARAKRIIPTSPSRAPSFSHLRRKISRRELELSC